MTRGPVGSVIIPAHNESTVIAHTLTALVSALPLGTLEVIVVCNGCTDDTAEVAASVHPAIRVVEIAESSKIAALQRGDDEATTFPRLYLDADVSLPGASALAVLDHLSRDGRVLAARPALTYDTRGASRLVRSYYRARLLIPSLFNRLWGAGVYGLSERGRARFRTWPAVVGDDLFVDSLFTDSEIAVISGDPVVVRVPRTARALLAVLRRGAVAKTQRLQRDEVGGDELVLRQPLTSTLWGLVRSIVAGPTAALDVLVYIGFACLARLDRFRRVGTPWERDDSSRQSLPGPGAC